MLQDLEHLIALQRLDSAISSARTEIEQIPFRTTALESRLVTSSEAVSTAQQSFSDHKADRQAQDKKLSEVQTRLNRLKEQLMEVKTNEVYKSIQLEIGNAEESVRHLEDRILEFMLEADELTANVERAEADLATERATVDAERAELERERSTLERQLEELQADRTKLTGKLGSEILSVFENLAGHLNGVAVVEARDGRCSSCQVRLRPQLYNDIRLNKSLIRCESCQRILYFVDNSSGQGAGEPG
jgi:predicted  nucleic acid-binding Zn-ribbon protein